MNRTHNKPMTARLMGDGWSVLVEVMRFETAPQIETFHRWSDPCATTMRIVGPTRITIEGVIRDETVPLPFTRHDRFTLASLLPKQPEPDDDGGDHLDDGDW